MKRFTVLLFVVFMAGSLFVFTGLQSCKHEPMIIIDQNTESQPPAPLPDTNSNSVLDGVELYLNNCALCHGSIDTSNKLGATVTQIQVSISTINSMKSLSSLTMAQIQAIADALKTTSQPPPNPSDGTALYTNYCAGCHGSLASSTKRGATLIRIQNGISNVSDMQSLASLTTTQIQAIADALKSTSPPPTDGATLYANYCAGCHHPLTSSSKLGASSSRIQNGISTVSDMQSLSFLTTTQIQAIANILASTPMPTDGAALYDINCARCHHPIANSEVGGSSASEIQHAINEKNQMKYLSVLTSAQIQAIADALANINGGGD